MTCGGGVAVQMGSGIGVGGGLTIAFATMMVRYPTPGLTVYGAVPLKNWSGGFDPQPPVGQERGVSFEFATSCPVLSSNVSAPYAADGFVLGRLTKKFVFKVALELYVARIEKIALGVASKRARARPIRDCGAGPPGGSPTKVCNVTVAVVGNGVPTDVE